MCPLLPSAIVLPDGRALRQQQREENKTMRNEASRPFGLGENRSDGGCVRPRADSILALLWQESGAHTFLPPPRIREGDTGIREGTNTDIHPDTKERTMGTVPFGRNNLLNYVSGSGGLTTVKEAEQAEAAGLPRQIRLGYGAAYKTARMRAGGTLPSPTQDKEHGMIRSAAGKKQVLWEGRARAALVALLMAALAASVAAGVLLYAPPAQAQGVPSGTTITVNTSTDEDNTDGDCSLREAIKAANTNLAVDACPAGSGSGEDEIGFNTGSATATITLGSTLPNVTDGAGLAP